MVTNPGANPRVFLRRFIAGTIRSIAPVVLLLFVLALSLELRASTERVGDAREQVRTLATELGVAEVERATLIALSGLKSIDGILLNGAREAGELRWLPAEKGASLAVFVTPSCERSPLLLEQLLADLKGRGVASGRVLVSSLAGDIFAVERWVEQFGTLGLARVMIQPSVEGKRLRVPVVPTVVVWEDGVLVDVLVGVDRYEERRPLLRTPAPGGESRPGV